MPVARISSHGGMTVVILLALGGCGKIRQNDPDAVSKMQVQAKLQKAACASPTAYDRLKGLLFDAAIGARRGDRANLDVLADYSVVRMEKPVVKGWDPSLDITSCRGRFILELPPGAERGFGGQRRLQADLDYTAQAAADGNGFVYQQKGAEPIVAQLAAFNLTSGAYRPPPAIDEPAAGPLMAAPTAIARADTPAPPEAVAPARPAAAATAKPNVRSPAAEARAPGRPAPPEAQPARIAERDAVEPSPGGPRGRSGEARIRAFYGALGAGNGAAASAQIIPEKRTSGAFSPAAMTRFYGRLAEPIRLTGIEPIGGGAYRVRYRYSAGRSRCDGGAVVRLANRDGRDLIRSIQALSGC